ncbi:MAG: hypothetical protein R2932_59535 [Caldilineaceae bacterium]
MSRITSLLLILLAFALRIAALDAKGLSYDEAATALMARATPAAIVAFHWRAAFEHPPLWQLLMHGWSLVAGEREFALRYLAVLAGTLLIPFMVQLVRHFATTQAAGKARLWGHGLPILTALLATLAPILIYYSQEARMYALVVTAAVAALVALSYGLDIVGARSTLPLRSILAIVLLHWAMVGLHYYSVLLVLAEAIYCLLWLMINRADRRQWLVLYGVLGLALLPLVVWLALAPGFHDTLRITLADTTPKPPVLTFLAAFWRELSFASVRWESTASRWGYLWLPLIGLGAVALLYPRPTAPAPGGEATNAQPAGGPANRVRVEPPFTRPWLLLLVAFVPVAVSAALFPALATRYLLYVVPALLCLLALGISRLGRWHWSLGGLGLALALVVPVLALPHYYGPYVKSDYRAMAAYLQEQRQADEAILLEGPRQHLLAKYYLPPGLPIYTAPAIDLPPYWPVNAPPVVPETMDDVIQGLLRDYRGVWLSLTAEDEVDRGEFVPKYLTAVAFEQDCVAWLDVRLCHYLSPQTFTPQLTTRIDAQFNDDLSLQQGELALVAGPDAADLLVTLHWQALQTPRADYRVTLRLLDTTGALVSQRDTFPIGPLLPPTTWQAGDEKPGYMALPLSPTLPAGAYRVTVNLYDPADGAPAPHRTTQTAGTTEPIILAILTVDDTMSLHAPVNR